MRRLPQVPLPCGGVRLWPVVSAQDAAHHILIDLHTESQGDLLGNARPAPTGIAPLPGHDGVDEFLVWSLRAGSTPALGRKILEVLDKVHHVVPGSCAGEDPFVRTGATCLA